MTEADANVDDNQSYQEWTKAGAKQISNQIGEIHLQIVAKNKVAIPGGDGRVCRIVDGADGKKQQSRTNHLWLKEGKNARRVELVTCQTRKEQKTWSTAPLKFEMPGPGKVTNIPAVAFSPSTCSKSCADLKKPTQKKTTNEKKPDNPQQNQWTYQLHPVVVNFSIFHSLNWIDVRKM